MAFLPKTTKNTAVIKQIGFCFATMDTVYNVEPGGDIHQEYVTKEFISEFDSS